jgi:gag-polypeptide of LTR copia-type
MDYGLDVMSIMDSLKNIFQEKAHVKRARLIKVIAKSRLAEGGQVGMHVMKLISYFRQLKKLEAPFSQGVAQDFILNSLPSSYYGFVMNYKMQGMDESLDELQGMLITIENDLKKGK